MKNFLSKHYKRYYIMTADRQWTEATRTECLAQSDSPTSENPYKQRWFYDGEQFSYIVRLPRNEQGEALHRINAADVKNEQRYQARRFACVVKGTGDCDNDCQNCQRKKYPRTIELDKPLASDGDSSDEAQYFEIETEESGYAEIEQSEDLDALLTAAGLTEKQKRLFLLHYCAEKTTYEIAVALGINQSNAHRQLETIKKALKKYYKNLL